MSSPLLPHFNNFALFLSHLCKLQCDALMSVESAAPLPKDQRDMKVVQVFLQHPAFFHSYANILAR
jgi:hypothetical protein